MNIALNTFNISSNKEYSFKRLNKDNNLSSYEINNPIKNLKNYNYAMSYYNSNLDSGTPIAGDVKSLENVLNNPESLNNLKLFFNQRAKSELAQLKLKSNLTLEEQDKITGFQEIINAFPSIDEYAHADKKISFSGALSKEDKSYCHKVIHSSSAVCGGISAAMGEGAAVGADTPFLWGTQGFMFLALQKRLGISTADHALYIVRQLMMGQVIGVQGAKILISWLGIGTTAATGGAAAGPATATVRGVNSILSTGITEKMGWGYVSSYEKDNMKLGKQALQTAIYVIGAEIFGKTPDTILDALDPSNVQTALDHVPKETLSTFGNILRTLSDTVHLDRFGFMFTAGIAQNILFSKEELNKKELTTIVSTALLNTVIYDLLDYKYEDTITEEATDTIRAMSKELQSNPEVFKEFELARGSILEKLNLDKIGTQEFLNQFKNKKFVYNLAMISGELSKEVADKFRKRNFGKYAEENAKIADATKITNADSRRINAKLSPEEHKKFITDMNKIVNDCKERNKQFARSNFGLNQIGGYQNIKDKLTEIYSVPCELKKKGFEIDIPDVILFYGPSGTGKTTTGRALAEDTGSRFRKKNFDSSSNEKIFKWVKDVAIESEEIYKNTGRRTIIQLNEFGKLADDPVLLDEVVKFMKECSEKYHVSLFLTTNNPLEINPEILSLAENKIPMGPADGVDIEEILRYYIADTSVENLNYRELVEEISKVTPQNAYSNSQLEEIIERLPKNTEITQQDLIETINMTAPQIKTDALNKFEAEKKELNKE